MKIYKITSISKKLLISIIIFNIIVIIIYTSVFVIIKKKNEFTSVLNSELRSQIKKEDELKIINDNLRNTEYERSRINSYFARSGEEGVVEFMENIESMSKIANVSMEVNSILIKKQENDQNSPVEDMKLSLEIDGDWDDVIYFLKLLENIPYKKTFERVYVEKNSDELSWKGMFNINILKLSEKNV